MCLQGSIVIDILDLRSGDFDEELLVSEKRVSSFKTEKEKTLLSKTNHLTITGTVASTGS